MDAEATSEYDSGNESSGSEDDEVLLDGDASGVLGCRERVEQEEEFPYDVLSTEEIVQDMVNCIKEVNTVVQISPTHTRILLNHLKWDKEKLYERYFDGDRDSFFREAHIVNPQKLPGAGGSNGSSSSSKAFRFAPSQSCLEVCEICLREMPHFMMTGLACGDRFCTECWTVYLTTKIMDEGNVQRLTCAAQTCDTLIDDQTVMNLTKDPNVKLKYQHLITNSFIECNRLLKWCPQPGCNNAIKAHYVDARPVTCTCGHTFCFSCSRNLHDPIKCQLLKKWQKKCDDDSETSNWIAANTKECPKCNITIEKDGGCNHMICKNQSCKFHFCWVCLGPWNPHGSAWFNCNRYDEDVAKAARDAQEKSRAALQRYLFYCNRYMNHMNSLKFENKLYASVKVKMEEMQQHNLMSWIEVQFLKKAVDVLCQCRQTLMYTYVFAYYLKKNNQSVIFEHNQRDLENATEQLSEYLERDITQENLLAIKQKVQDKYRYCESRRKVLMEHVHEGYEKECWEYTDGL